MNKAKLMVLAMAATAMTAQARGTIDVQGVTYNVDTVFHAKVGPGTTQTTLHLSASANPLVVHYLTIDRSTPNVDIRAVIGKDKVAGTETTSSMAKRKSVGNLNYFCGVNADFFTTSGSATNGTSKVGSPATSCTVDREVFKTSNSQYQFSMDMDGVARICRLNYYTGTATLGEKVTLFKGINVGAPNNGITIYTPKYWGSANQTDYADNSYQVSAKLAAGSDPMYAGCKFKLEVTSEPTTDGDMAIPADGYVIFARGTSTTGCNTGAKNFVKALKPGDIVEFDNIVLTPDNTRIVPNTIISGNPKCVGEGKTLDTMGERNDAKDRHPRSSIGISQSGDSIIMMVIEGRSSASVGVNTAMEADVMRYAGAYEALNIDGGGSSTLYTQALGVRNKCSDGNERAVGNAIFAVLDAPEDKEIAEIRFVDWRVDMPQCGIYTPVIYGFNKYGKMVSDNVKGYTLSSECGKAVDGGESFQADKVGCYALTATLGGATATVPVYVAELSGTVEPYLPKVLLNATREYKAQLKTTVGDEMRMLAPEAFDWSSADASVATVSSEGVIKGVANGQTTITGKLGEIVCELPVTIEISPKAYLPVEPTGEAAAWTVTKSTAISAANVTPLENGLKFKYQLKTTRGPKVTASLKKDIYSLPEALHLVVAPQDGSVLTSVVVNLKAANGARDVEYTISGPFEAGKTKDIEVPLSEMLDPADQGIYPVQFVKIAIVPGGVTGTKYTIDMPAIETKYAEETLGVSDIAVDGEGNVKADRKWYNLQGMPVAQPSAPGLYISDKGEKVMQR